MGESRVVVGLDGCDACRAALRYAIEEAARRGCELVIVAAYEHSSVIDPVTGYPTVTNDDPAYDVQAMAQHCLQQALSEAPCTCAAKITTTEMPPIDALAAAAHGSCIIVIGRHHGQIGGGKPAGSTSTALLNHSPVPVISVPPGFWYEHTRRD